MGRCFCYTEVLDIEGEEDGFDDEGIFDIIGIRLDGFGDEGDGVIEVLEVEVFSEVAVLGFELFDEV